MPKFSVVIPLYNKKNYIKTTLLSVLKQTFSDFEVIVVDDGSIDGSLEQIKGISDSRLKVVSKENAGVSVARNTGIDIAVGKYIAFLDADDFWRSDYLETINNLTLKYPESEIFVTAYNILLSNNKINYSSDEERVYDGCLQSYWETLKNRYEFVWTSATTIKRKAIVEAGYFTPGEKIGEDLDLFARVAQINPRVAFSSKRCVDYNRSAENNARLSVSVAYPKAYLSILEYERNNSERSEMEKKCIIQKFDKKMIAYIYTLILSGEKNKARMEIKNWNPINGLIYKVLLWVASYMPKILTNQVYAIRLKVF
jgi:glycosyltransferase involved in cell wall biosynthesis